MSCPQIGARPTTRTPPPLDRGRPPPRRAPQPPVRRRHLTPRRIRPHRAHGHPEMRSNLRSGPLLTLHRAPPVEPERAGQPQRSTGPGAPARPHTPEHGPTIRAGRSSGHTGTSRCSQCHRSQQVVMSGHLARDVEARGRLVARPQRTVREPDAGHVTLNADLGDLDRATAVVGGEVVAGDEVTGGAHGVLAAGVRRHVSTIQRDVVKRKAPGHRYALL